MRWHQYKNQNLAVMLCQNLVVCSSLVWCYILSYFGCFVFVHSF